jgi:hypothetical protein
VPLKGICTLTDEKGLYRLNLASTNFISTTMSQRGCQPCSKSSCSLYIAEINACVQEWQSYASRLEHELQRYQPRPDPPSLSSTSTYSVSPKPIASHSIPLQGASYQPSSSSPVSCPPTYTQPADPEPVPLQNAPLSASLYFGNYLMEASMSSQLGTS